MKQTILILVFIILLAAPVIHAAPLMADGVDIRIILVNQQPDPVAPGGQFDVRFRIENNGSEIANNVRIKIIEEYPFAIAGENERNIGSLGRTKDASAGFTAKFTGRVSSSAADGTYKIKIAYSVDSGAWAVKEITGITVQSEDAIIAVASSLLTPEKLVQGNPGKLAITLKNYAGSAMTNIRAELQTLGSHISPIGSTNIKVIDRLDGGQSAKIEYSLIPDFDADSKVYPLTFVFTYTDTLGNSLRRNETIGIPVFSKPSYDLNIEESKVYTAGSTGQVVVSISDTGASGINYLVIELLDAEGYKVVSSPRVYVGNLKSDDFETASFDIHALPSANGNTNLALKLTYKDDYNQEYVQQTTLPLKIYTRKEAEQYGLVAPVNFVAMIIPGILQILLLVFAVFMLIDCIKKPMPTYKKLLWAIVIMTLIGAIIYYLIGRKKLAK
jgi:hypothetical protein